MNKVIFIDRAQAERYAPRPEQVIISLHDASELPAELQPGWTDRLTLCFNDADVPAAGQIIFDASMAEQVWNFVDKHKGQAEELVVHCHHGISRSGAIALGVSEMLNVQCYKDKMPVSFENYKIYNKRVYRELLTWYGDHR